ncbi:serine/threonine-protein kinase [Paractinoplanes lichenicola]|uniref:non-specific serine/threonine protein kinase n=1 Tax=Paractinoplanes lichenicola TaxID=2802976 RepID=A0ABS1VH18_9ACTN|nr:serine/threonine-protein kinase [Actinoplanes lichenicola]MBL7253454.1 serine/threonine protein kinase [Actinoplanes lichenicola]
MGRDRDAAKNDLVGGRYRLLELVGSGGMGRVWRAQDELLQRVVAVKEITVPSTALTATQSMREARAAARLDHPGVITVFDVVWQEEHSWLVMEYVPGRSLQQVVDADGPLSPGQAARLGLHVLSALRSAHAAGVLHRDVKPGNILLSTDGRIVLTDFGLAVISDPESGAPDPLLGSPQYVAPERLRAQETGTPADLWSLGATLYTAVEGRAPFQRDDVEASLQALLNDEPDPPRRAGSLTAPLLALLKKDPESRPDAEQTAGWLETIAGAPKPIAGTGFAPVARGIATVTARQRRRPRTALVAGLSLALLVTGGGAYAARSHQTGTAQPAAVESSVPVATPSLPAGDLCGVGADRRTVTPETTRVPAGLPEGWIWSRDPAGFALALPAGWQRSTSGNEVCFGDPAGLRAFKVTQSPVRTRQPLAYWQAREKDGGLPGYQRISMGVLLLKRGGADWEYTWRPDSDTTLRERRILIATSDDRSYLLRWTTAAPDWAQALPVQKQLVNLFASAR